MDKEAKKFIKECGFLIKNVTFIDEPIVTVDQYNKFYDPSGGSVSDNAYCIFYNSENRNKGTIHLFSEEMQKAIFSIDP